EAESPEQHRVNRYVDDPDVVAPSVVTLNALAAAHAVNEFLFATTGLKRPDADTGYVLFDALSRTISTTAPASEPSCPHCGNGVDSTFARGDARRLPVRHASMK